MAVYDFGLRLKELRESKKLSQSDVASRLKVSTKTISAYERNIQTPRLEHLIDLAVLYNSSVDYILNLSDRSNVYIDDIPESHQQIILRTIEALKNELALLQFNKK